jgi:hypothetical protein
MSRTRSLSDALFHGVLFDEDAPEAEELRQLAQYNAATGKL